MDFEGVPPEINSERIYCGYGSGSMSAAAWAGLGCRRFDVAAGCGPVTARQVDGRQGPTAMIQAAEPCIGWVNATAVTPVTSVVRL
jgi:PPE-repeat protein